MRFGTIIANISSSRIAYPIQTLMKPRIAIPAPTSTNLEYNGKSWPQYAEAITRAGGEPVEIPLHATPRETADLINTYQALPLPGSPADVNPQKYGQDPAPETSPSDP